jgi:class 3 adenylate cyclase
VKPDVRITWNDGFALAYQVVGQARDDLVYLPGFASNVDLMWDIPSYRRFLERLSSFARLITLDRRGVGCSDRLPPGVAPTLEDLVDDVVAVMEAASSDSATIVAVQASAFVALLLAATHPERVERLILFGASPSWVRSDDLPDEMTTEQWASDRRRLERVTKASDEADGYIRSAAPSFFGDPAAKRALASLFLNTQGLGAGLAEQRMFSETDLRAIIPSIVAPTICVRREDDDSNPVSSVRYLVEHLRAAEYVEIPGADELPWIGDQEPIHELIERSMGVEPAAPAPGRRLSTVLFTDIVGSSASVAELGDSAWASLIAEHHKAVRDLLAANGGTEIDTAGDGFFATFEGPAQAVRCAMACVRAVSDLGLTIRAGVHTGEVETVAGKPGGSAVVVGARIAALAGGSDVLVSRTVTDLVAGSGLTFEDTGEHELKGVPDRWRLFRVVPGARGEVRAMEKVDTTVEELLDMLPDDVRPTMEKLDEIVTSCLPGRTRSVWEGTFWGGTEQRIIGYGDIVQPRPRGPDVEWFLVGLARQARHYSLYVNAVDDGRYLVAAYADRLGTVKVGSASIGFARLDDVDVEGLRALLARAHELTPAGSASGDR